MSNLPQATSPAPPISREQVELVRRTLMPGASDDELQFFLARCQKMGLDPLANQLYPVPYQKGGQRTYTFQMGIDGLRSVAESTGEYEGQVGPYWCGPDGQWADVWLSDDPPTAAKVGILRKGFKDPVFAVAKFASFVQSSQLWKKMPDHMLAIRAETHALKKAFPAKLSGIYGPGEIDSVVGHADHSASEPAHSAGDHPRWMNEAPGFKKTGHLSWLELALDSPLPDDEKGRRGRQYLHCLEEFDGVTEDVRQKAKTALVYGKRVMEEVRPSHYADEVEP